MLSGDEIQRRHIVHLLEKSSPAIQPNGVDLSLDAVWTFSANGTLGRADRLLAPREERSFDTEGWIDLQTGTYGFRYREAVDLPADSGGLCFPRSSLLRMGVYVPTAVWDAGYRGRGEGLLVVQNPHGVRLQHGARIAQLVLFRLTEPANATYAGRYQDENPAQDPEHSNP
jgi:dUTP pyrophosphatase